MLFILILIIKTFKMQAVPIYQLNKSDVYYVYITNYWKPEKFIATYMGSEMEWGSRSYLFKYIDKIDYYLSISSYGSIIRKKTNARKQFLIKIFETIINNDFAVIYADYL